jgi:hypothetical protein
MTTLTDYETAVYRLIQAPSSQTPLVPIGTVDDAVNTARGQLATEAECVRVSAELSVSPAAGQYSFSLIDISSAVGVAGPIQVRMAVYKVGTGRLRVNAREWEWFNNFVGANASPKPGPPKYWAQYGQGANGTLVINLLDTNYSLGLDTVCFPTPLATGETEKAIPYSWTDAVPYYAAWQILMSLQRQADANAMLQRYETFVQRARTGATPSVLPHQYEQVPDPTLPDKIGASPRQQQPPQATETV